MQIILSPSLLKIDVEPHELKVLHGADLILSNKILLAIIIKTNGMVYDLTCMILNFYQNLVLPYSYDPFNCDLIPSITKNENTIFVRDLDYVKHRLRSSEKYKLVNGFF